MTNYKNISLNYISSVFLLIMAYLFYTYVPYYYHYFAKAHSIYSYTISGHDVHKYFVYLYLIVLIPYYFTFPEGYKTKSRGFYKAFYKVLFTNHISKKELTILLSTLVKFFFLPLMLFWLVEHLILLFHQANTYFAKGIFFDQGYWALFNLILLLDTLFFTIGYAIEHPKLKNEIRSVEPTFFGWFIAIICYPPFNGMTNQMLGWHSSDIPMFSNETFQIVGAVLILSLMTIYTWASIALNLKASNLTNRGIVSTGPYKYVRHPAYTAKNLAWWIGSIGIVANLLPNEIQAFLFGIFSVLAWTTIYYFRAMTEERHLMADPDYRAYCKKVPYRFIPGLI